MIVLPLDDRVLVKTLGPAKEKPKHGIVLPDNARRANMQRGFVVAVGTGRPLDNGGTAPLTVKVGDHVLYERFEEGNLTIDGEEHLILQERDILAVVQES